MRKTLPVNLKHRSITAVVAAALLSEAPAASAAPAAQVSQVPATPPEPAKGSVGQLNWLAGCGQGNEAWFSSRGGSVVGVGLTYLDDKTITSEAMPMYDAVAAQTLVSTRLTARGSSHRN